MNSHEAHCSSCQVTALTDLAHIDPVIVDFPLFYTGVGLIHTVLMSVSSAFVNDGGDH